MSICNGFEDLITQVVKTYNLNLHELIWIEHWEGCPELNEPEHYALVEFDIIRERSLNPRWSFLAESKLQILRSP